MSQSSFSTAEVIDIDNLMNSQAAAKDVGATVASNQAGKSLPQPPSAVGAGNGESVPGVNSSSHTNTSLAQNSGQVSSLAPPDLPRPVKTEGEASPSMTTVSQPPPTGLPATQHSGTPSSGGATVHVASSDVPSSSSPSLPVSVASIGSFGAFGSPLTALGTQLNLTPEEQAAAYKKANILALSALAKKGGPNAREMLAVQAKLQEFLTNLISLAGNSGQQLKSTVQMLVQQLVTGSISEQEFAMRIEKDLHSQHQPSLLPFLQNSVPHLRTRLQLQQAIMKELLQRQAGEKLQQQKIQEQKRVGATPLAVSTPGTVNSIHGAGSSPGIQPAVVEMLGPASAPASTGQPQNLKLNNVAAVAVIPNSSLPAPSTTGSVSTSQASVPLPISTTSLTAQLREKLAKISPKQRQTYVQQLNQPKQPLQTTQPQPIVVASSAQLSQATRSTSTSSTAINSNPLKVGVPGTVHVQQLLEQQKRLVKEQQQVSLTAVGSAAVKQAPIRSAVTSTPSGSNNLPGARTVGASVSPSKTGFANIKLVSAVNKSSSPPSSGATKGKGKVKLEAGKSTPDDEEEEDDEMDFSGVKTVNLQAESILPTNLGETMRTVRDEAFFALHPLKYKAMTIAQRYGIAEVSDEFLVLLSHGLQERLRDILEKVTVVSQHRTESLKDEDQYEVVSEVRGQLKVLESIDRLSHKRKQEREKEKILKAARSRSRAEDPEAAAKIKEQAKKLQQEEEQKIRDRAANEAALAAIGSGSKRKRLSAAGISEGGAGVTTGLLSHGQDTGSGHTSLLGAQASRQPKRRVTTRDLQFYMERTKETKKSLVLYRSLLK